MDEKKVEGLGDELAEGDEMRLCLLAWEPCWVTHLDFLTELRPVLLV